jgi:hypothetical protein
MLLAFSRCFLYQWTATPLWCRMKRRKKTEEKEDTLSCNTRTTTQRTLDFITTLRPREAMRLKLLLL